jgi:hypothetical protein
VCCVVDDDDDGDVWKCDDIMIHLCIYIICGVLLLLVFFLNFAFVF